VYACVCQCLRTSSSVCKATVSCRAFTARWSPSLTRCPSPTSCLHSPSAYRDHEHRTSTCTASSVRNPQFTTLAASTAVSVKHRSGVSPSVCLSVCPVVAAEVLQLTQLTLLSQRTFQTHCQRAVYSCLSTSHSTCSKLDVNPQPDQSTLTITKKQCC